MEIINGNRFKELADLVIDQQTGFPNSIAGKPRIIFLYTDWLAQFKSILLPKINWPFVLITHNADHSAPNAYYEILENPYLIRWFGMNVDSHHPKLTPIPIGIANPQWPHGNIEILNKVRDSQVEKTGIGYCNFDANTHGSRREILQIVQKYPWISFEKNMLAFDAYLMHLKSFEYVISPRGNSVDCHRIWESLYV